jgi:hypothetical protein
MSDWENYAWLHGGMNVMRNNTHVFSPIICHKIMQYELKKWGSLSPRNTKFQQSMPTNRKALLYFKLHFPPEIQNQILIEMNPHLETKIIKNLTFIRPCIIIYFYSKTNQMHNISILFYFGTTLYMFQTVFLSIIRSLRLYIQHQVFVIQVLWLLASKQPQNLYGMMLYVQS